MKKLPRLKKGQIVEILWEDTHIPQVPGWMTEEEHQQWSEGGALVRSVGIYVGKDKDFIRLVGDSDTESTCSYLRPINIGCGYIRNIYVLKRNGYA